MKWPAVIVVRVNDDQFPLFGDRHIKQSSTSDSTHAEQLTEEDAPPSEEEEERRILYVAMSRAKSVLVFTQLAERRSSPGLSRFLAPLLHGGLLNRIEVGWKQEGTSNPIAVSQQPIDSDRRVTVHKPLKKQKIMKPATYDAKSKDCQLEKNPNESMPTAVYDILSNAMSKSAGHTLTYQNEMKHAMEYEGSDGSLLREVPYSESYHLRAEQPNQMNSWGTDASDTLQRFDNKAAVENPLRMTPSLFVNFKPVSKRGYLETKDNYNK